MRCCPSCHRVWNEANEFCPADGTGLVLVEEGADPLVGLELDGRYRLESLIGVGGMGFVYLAQQMGLGRQVAVKMLFAERTRDPQSLRRFRREALALAGIDHPGVVRVLEYGDGGGTTPYIVMELLQGQPLDEVISVYSKLPPKHAVHVCAQLADALGSAHDEGVIHRDLKPANIQLDVRGRELSVRILDFGLALLADRADESGTGGGRLTRHGVIFGTPEYMSPEQINGEDAGAHSDLYSLGILLYELLTGSPPFIGPTSTAVLGMQIADEPPRLEVPGLEAGLEKDLAGLVAELLAKDPQARPMDGGSVSARLRAIEERLPDPGPPTDLVSAASRASNPDDATLEIGAPVPVLERGGATSERLWRGLTRHRDADLELESALSGHGRRRRVRRLLGGLLGGIGILAAIPIVYSYVVSMDDTGGEGTLLDPSAPTVGRLPPLTKVKLGDSPIRVRSADAIEEVPGGDRQRSYEEGRRQLERNLSERGLRPRDLRAHGDAMVMWEAQEDAARSGDWSRATAGLEDLPRAGGAGHFAGAGQGPASARQPAAGLRADRGSAGDPERPPADRPPGGRVLRDRAKIHGTSGRAGPNGWKLMRTMLHGLRPLPATALLLGFGLTGTALGEEPAHPRAAVVIHAEDGVDPFVEAYLFEVAATVLRSHGYRVAPPNATMDRLRSAGQRARACADDDACVRTVAGALSSPTLVFVDVSPLRERHVAIALATVVIRSDDVHRGEPVEASGSETDMAERVQVASAELAAQEPPCHVEVEAEGRLALRIRIGDSPAVSASSPLFVRAGTHEVAISAAGRSAWTGTLTCQPGRRYRIRAR